MIVSHCTLFFTTQHYGWVEQFFRADGTLGLSLQATIQLATARWSILGAGVNLYRVRASEVGSPRASYSWDVSGTPSSTPAMTPLVGAEIRVTAGPGALYHRSYMLRGLPEGSLVQTGGVWRWSPAWSGPATSWLSLLVSGGWQLQCWGRAGPTFPILSLAEAAMENADVAGEPLDPAQVDPATTIVVAAVQGTPILPPADPVTGIVPTLRVGRVRWFPPLSKLRAKVNGEYPVVYVGPGLAAWRGALPPAGHYVGGGYVQVRPRLYLPITSAELGGQVAKACGGPKRYAEPPPLPGVWPAPLVFPSQALLRLVPVPGGRFGGLLPSLPPGTPIPPPPPAVRTLANLQDLATFVWEGYQPPAPQLSLCIGIARVVNLTDTWLVVCSGTDLTQSTQALGITEDLAAAFGEPNQLTIQLQAKVLITVPPGADIVYAGHSLGGMALQPLCALDELFPRNAVRLITFGSPLCVLPKSGMPVVRLAMVDDIVPFCSPAETATTSLQWLAGVFMSRNYGAGFAPFQTYIDPDGVPPGPITRHTGYPGCTTLQQFGADGVPGSNVTYELGPISRFSAPG